ncbi:MAG: baseplate J/gp47 family protein [Oscillospiraceae bacterium]
MSNIIELENCPELNFIENMTLQETEDQMRELYAGYYRELTGRDPEIGDADTVNLLIKAFCAMEYQTMQYADAKGRMEMLKTSTGSALDALAALVGLTGKAPERATASVRFSLEEPRSVVVAIPAGTRVKTEDGKYFNSLGTPRSRRARAMRMLWCKLRKPERRAAASFRVQSKYW